MPKGKYKLGDRVRLITNVYFSGSSKWGPGVTFDVTEALVSDGKQMLRGVICGMPIEVASCHVEPFKVDDV